ncbi:EAL domain-containing protein [Glaciecola sp. 1036]|uniref:EAL domain-containing protein n=1 Tax=Alteromonadaceae TaxID=72275 RepID=UPI003D0929DA
MIFLGKFRQLSLSTQILILTLSLVILTVSVLSLNYWYQSVKYNKAQISRHMNAAENVILQYIDAKQDLLTSAAKSLNQNSEFKRSLLTSNKANQTLVMDNLYAQTNADVVVLLSANEEIHAAANKNKVSVKQITNALVSIKLKSPEFQFIEMNNNVHLLLSVQIDLYESTKGFVVMGYQLDSSALNELNQLTGLSLSLYKGQNVMGFSERTNPELNEKRYSIMVNQMAYWRENQYEYKRILLDRPADVSIVISKSLRENNKELTQLFTSLFVLGFGVILLSVILSGWVSRRITTPLSQLIEVTKRIAKGEFSVSELQASSSPEIRDLNSAFIAMENAIETRESEITYQAEHDKLTNLLNRQHLLARIEQEISTGNRFILVGINVRQFSQVNDTMGPQIGDKILQLVALRLSHYLGTNEEQNAAFAARLSGDDFLVCIQYRVVTKINHIVDDLYNNLCRAYTMGELTLNLNFRIAIVSSFNQKNSADVLVRRVAIAMNAARNEQLRIRFYRDGEDEAYLSKLQIIENLRVALEADNGELYLTYQPKLDLKTQSVDKAEALIRWIDKDGEFVNPEVFIGLAEQSGLIVTLTRWVIRAVVKQLAQWHKMGHSFKVAINMSAQDIQHPQFVNYLLDQVTIHDVSAAQIIIELTERDLVDNEELVVERLTYLKSLGFEISVDDYGIGQSSLSKLKHLPIDELKIDKSFIMTLSESEIDQNIVSSTIALGHKLDLRVVAEGVEDKESLRLLEKFGCDQVQGYYLSHPVKPKAFIDWYIAYSTDAVAVS